MLDEPSKTRLNMSIKMGFTERMLHKIPLSNECGDTNVNEKAWCRISWHVEVFRESNLKKGILLECYECTWLCKPGDNTDKAVRYQMKKASQNPACWLFTLSIAWNSIAAPPDGDTSLLERTPLHFAILPQELVSFAADIRVGHTNSPTLCDDPNNGCKFAGSHYTPGWR